MAYLKNLQKKLENGSTSSMYGFKKMNKNATYFKTFYLSRKNYIITALLSLIFL